ncbi:testis-expressed protein 13D-like [Mesocricetus auratus]|uniref:Testis-expressed protein 13D-like n=1 Tax=Mesocricetus auratus TaxID=10036 RepID=A0ABM2XAK2_MESAU|nr:testis-expressed protein 13D-like [Mesocricetus auratus]
MAVDLGDFSCGFRHSEVIRFINNEILINGGGPEFYLAFCLRPWNEIEDQLRAILIDPEVPRSLKRACTWSALALSVRLGARQREQQAYIVGLLQDEMGQRPLAPRASVSEVWQLHQQREEAVTQLRSTQAALQQAMRECDMLRRRLYPAERSSSQTAPLAQNEAPGAQAQQLGLSVVPLNSDHSRFVGAMGGYDRQYLEAQMSAATNVFYMPESTSPWPLAMQPSVPVPYQIPPHPPFLLESPFLMPFPPSLVTDTEGGVVVPVRMPPVCPSGSLAAPNSQDPAGQWDQRLCMAAEGPPVSQPSVAPGNVKDARREGDLQQPQDTVALGGIRGYIQEQDSQRTQERTTLANVGNDSEVGKEKEEAEDSKEDSTSAVPAEGKAAAGAEAAAEGAAEAAGDGGGEAEPEEKEEKAAAVAATACGDTAECLWSLQELHLTEEEGLDSQSEKSLKASAPNPLGSSGSQIKGMVAAQPPLVWESWSQVVRESPKKQQPLLPKKPKPKVEHPSKSQSGVNWFCPKCKAMNFSWRTACYKCKRVNMPIEGGGKTTGSRRW